MPGLRRSKVRNCARLSLPTVLTLVALGWLIAVARAEQLPNVLWISCEDISPHLQCYGYPEAKTPNLDALAECGVRYTRAFTTTPVCATNRSSIITGMFPTAIGSQFMRCETRLPTKVRCFTEYLRDAGYYCTNNSKEDYNFKRPESAWDASNPRAHWRGRKAGQPFFAVFNFTLSHESKVWPRGEAHLDFSKDLQPSDRQDPQQLRLPPYYPDTPEVRRDWANYYENITQIDHQAGQVLKQLADDGLDEDTIVFFLSDHGAGLPRAKRWAYDSGTLVPLIVVIPPKYRTDGQGQPATVDGQLVSFIDLAPTMMNLTGLPIPTYMQGRAFLGPDLTAERDYAINVRDRMDGRYDMIRAVRDKRYRYVRNYMPWKPYAQHLSYAEVNQTMKALRKAKADGTLPGEARLFMSDRKPTEELYDTIADPHEVRNLAESDDPRHQEMLSSMRQGLAKWEVESGDLGLIPEPILRAKEAQLGDCLAILQQADEVTMLSEVREIIAPGLEESERLERARKGLASDSPTVRYWSVLTVADHNHLLHSQPLAAGKPVKAVLDLLLPLLADGDPTVRVTVASALCRAGSLHESLPVLLAGLQDNSPWVRLLVTNYLAELAPDDPRVIEALESLDAQGNDDYVLLTAEYALHRIDGRELPQRWGNY